MSAELEKPERFDYAVLDVETRAFVEERAERIHNLARMTAAGIVQIGQYLTEVKARLEHGQFRQWILAEFGWQKSSANNFMHVFENVKCPNFGQLQIDVSALYLIAAPKTPEPVRAEIIRHAEVSTENITHSTVREAIAEYNKTGDAGAAVARIFETVRQAREEMNQLPSPAEARRIAIATGAHTCDRNGVYQPPMTVAAQAKWRGDWQRVGVLYEFLRWIRDASAEEISATIERRGWKKDFGPFTHAAAAWLNDFERCICQDIPPTEKN